jgi:hypothetical protein
VSTRPAAAVLSALALTALVVAFALARGLARAPLPPPRIAPPSAPPSPRPALAPVDPERLRDIFRFADFTEEPVDPHPEPRGARSGAVAPAPPAPPASTPPPGPHLVGVVRRSGRLLAALAADGEVQLAGPGDSVAGVLVLSVEEDAVRIRAADGSEATLEAP